MSDDPNDNKNTNPSDSDDNADDDAEDSSQDTDTSSDSDDGNSSDDSDVNGSDADDSQDANGNGDGGDSDPDADDADADQSNGTGSGDADSDEDGDGSEDSDDEDDASDDNTNDTDASETDADNTDSDGTESSADANSGDEDTGAPDNSNTDSSDDENEDNGDNADEEGSQNASVAGSGNVGTSLMLDRADGEGVQVARTSPDLDHYNTITICPVCFFELALIVIPADSEDEIPKPYPPEDGTLVLKSSGGYEQSIAISAGVRTDDQYCSFRFYNFEKGYRDDTFTATLKSSDTTQTLFEDHRIFSYVLAARQEGAYEPAFLCPAPEAPQQNYPDPLPSSAPPDSDEPATGMIQLDDRQLPVDWQ